MNKEPFLILDELIILELEPNVKNFFESHFIFSVNANEIRFGTYPILDGLIIQ